MLPPKYPFLAPQLPPTGLAVPRCYASPLRSCFGKISSEHFMSQAVLDQMDEVVITGVRGRSDGVVASVKSLGTNVLCQRHNSAVSTLDTTAGLLFGHINDRIDPKPGRPPALANPLRLRGHHVERWLLKYLCGVLASGMLARTDPADERKWPVPERWVRLLYGLEPLPDDWGLYGLLPAKPPTRTARAQRAEVLWLEDSGEPAGMVLFTAGMYLGLQLVDGNIWGAHNLTAERRPRRMVVHREDVAGSLAEVHLDWSGEVPGRTVNATARLGG